MICDRISFRSSSSSSLEDDRVILAHTMLYTVVPDAIASKYGEMSLIHQRTRVKSQEIRNRDRKRKKQKKKLCLIIYDVFIAVGISNEKSSFSDSLEIQMCRVARSLLGTNQNECSQI